MNVTAAGQFQVRMIPAGEPDAADGTALGQSALDKTYAGDLVARAQGQMLTAITTTRGSAVYVAIERIDGVLHGRRGTFCLAHYGRMTRGAQHQCIEIVPDSGTGELSGISGRLTIRIAEGVHHYELDYRLE
jgi:hypothetical protein